MIDKVALNRSVRRVVEQCTGMAKGTVRPSDQLGPVGAGTDSFASVLIMMNKAGLPAEQRWDNVPNDPDEKVIETQNGQVLITASIQFFRNDAMQLASKLRDRITLSSALQLMQSLGLGYVSAKPVQDMTKVVNQNWEARAAVDIDFYVVSTETDVVATYNTFPVVVSTDGHS